MTAATPTTEPTSIPVGATARWLRSFADWPAGDGWVLTYELVNADARITFNASAQGDDHLVNVAAATTAAWTAGAYDWRATVALSGDVFVAGRGRVTIEPAFGAATDARSAARRTLEAIEATLEGRASSAVAEYQIAGRALKHIPIADLLKLRDRYRADVRAEDAAAAIQSGLSAPPGRIQVRFGP